MNGCRRDVGVLLDFKHLPGARERFADCDLTATVTPPDALSEPSFLLG